MRCAPVELALVAALLAGSAAATAVCDSTPSCLTRIEAAQADTRTVSARFTQTKHLSLLDEPLVSTGRFTFKRPDRVRLDVETPRQATVLVNGRDISIPGMTESDKKQLGMTPMAQLFTELGAMFGGSPAALQKHFDVVAQGTDAGITVTLTPKLADWQRLFRRIQLRFAEPELTLAAMELDDPLGDRLEIVMSDVQRNADLPDSVFQP